MKLYLPATTKSSPEAEAAGETPDNRGAGEVVLIAEDDEMVRKYVTSQVSSLGYQTIAMPDGRSALDLLRGGNEAFMSGAEAVASSFRDLRNHQAALAAAAHSAITTTLATLDPTAIEEEAARNAGLFAGGRAGASWKHYRTAHEALIKSIASDANHALATALRAVPSEATDRPDDGSRKE